jgi:hypothetical protein
LTAIAGSTLSVVLLLAGCGTPDPASISAPTSRNPASSTSTSSYQAATAAETTDRTAHPTPTDPSTTTSTSTSTVSQAPDPAGLAISTAPASEPLTAAPPSTGDEPTTTPATDTQAGPEVATASDVSPGPGPLGTTSVGTWWSPPADQYSAASLWVFDPVREAIPYGFRKDYQPTGSITHYEIQYSFVYTYNDLFDLNLSYPSGTVQDLSILDYDSQLDTLQVNWEGYIQTWYGCSSGQLPPAALAACR